MYRIIPDKLEGENSFIPVIPTITESYKLSQSCASVSVGYTSYDSSSEHVECEQVIC